MYYVHVHVDAKHLFLLFCVECWPCFLHACIDHNIVAIHTCSTIVVYSVTREVRHAGAIGTYNHNQRAAESTNICVKLSV